MAEMPGAGTIDMKLEVVTLPVSDVDRAKSFYQSLGWRLDADIAVGDAFRVVQLTPPQSGCSISFGKGLTTDQPGSVQRLLLAVYDIDAAREDLISRGAKVSGVFPWPAGLFRARTRKAGPTRPMPRSAIRTGTGGCSRRSRPGFLAGNGRTWRQTSRPGRPCSVKRPSITTTTRRPTPRTTGGTGIPLTSARASMAGRRRRRCRPRIATWTKSCTSRPSEEIAATVTRPDRLRRLPPGARSWPRTGGRRPGRSAGPAPSPGRETGCATSR